MYTYSKHYAFTVSTNKLIITLVFATTCKYSPLLVAYVLNYNDIDRISTGLLR